MDHVHNFHILIKILVEINALLTLTKNMVDVFLINVIQDFKKMIKINVSHYVIKISIFQKKIVYVIKGIIG